MENQNEILIIDDDGDFANFVCDVAKSLGFTCTVTTNADDFIKALTPAITSVFMDLNIPQMDGIELLRYIDAKKIKTDIILMSGVDKRVLESAHEFATAKGLSVISHFQKPIRLADLEKILMELTKTKEIKVEQNIEPEPDKFIITKAQIINAIQRNDFTVFYQPKIEIATDKLLGVEALVRWIHPEFGMIMPDKFISLAESFGLIDDISWRIYETALTEISSLKRKIGFTFMLSLNLSPFSLVDVEFPDKILKLIGESTVDPENIIFEITESGLLKELSSALDIFTRLRLKNLKLSIDDFGTGYAMMQQLKLIPATEIKIDKSFIQTMLTVESSKVSVKKIIEIGHELGMKVTGEGIDTIEQLECLKELNCDVGQGHFFSKPLPLDELIVWINQKNS